MNGQMMNYKASLECKVNPILSSELPKVKVNYKALLAYAKEKGMQVIDLTDTEKNMFVSKEV